MRHRTVRRMGAFLVLLCPLGLALMASLGCSQDLSRTENSSPVVLTESEEGRKAQAEAGAFAKLRQDQEAKARARALKRKKVYPEGG